MDVSHYRMLPSALKKKIVNFKLWPLYLSSTGNSQLVLRRKKKGNEESPRWLFESRGLT